MYTDWSPAPWVAFNSREKFRVWRVFFSRMVPFLDLFPTKSMQLGVSSDTLSLAMARPGQTRVFQSSSLWSIFKKKLELLNSSHRALPIQNSGIIMTTNLRWTISIIWRSTFIEHYPSSHPTCPLPGNEWFVVVIIPLFCIGKARWLEFKSSSFFARPRRH